MADPSPSSNPNPNPNPSPETQLQQQPTTPRTDYRKGNWTVQETLTLITAKRLDDDRRSAAASSTSPVGRSAEQRWKWVENYCCAHGCLRSQNQCNDKWDNLLRDYKKVRDYESRIAGTEPGTVANRKSYWEMERHERKEFNLPTNMGFDVHEALTDVLNRRNARRIAVSPTPVMMLPPPPPPQPPKDVSPPPAATQAGTQTEESAELEESEEDEPEMKRRKVRDLGMSVVRTATMLSQTLMTCEEKKEQRHRELMELEERRLRLEEKRLRLEEERSEMNKQAMSGLLAAVNGLSNAVHALVSEQRRTGDGSLM